MEEQELEAGRKHGLIRTSAPRKQLLVSKRKNMEMVEVNLETEAGEDCTAEAVGVQPLQVNIRSLLNAISNESTSGMVKKSLKYTFCASFVHHIFYQNCWIDVPFNIFESRMKELIVSSTNNSRRLSLKERRAVKFYEELVGLFDCFEIISQSFEIKEMHFGCGSSLFNTKCRFQLVFCDVMDREVAGKGIEKLKRSLLQQLIQSAANTPTKPFSSSILKSPIHFAIQVIPKTPNTISDIRKQYSDCPKLSDFFSWHDAPLHYHEKKRGRSPLTVQILQEEGDEKNSVMVDSVWFIASSGIKPP
jgi:hypothetical protein